MSDVVTQAGRSGAACGAGAGIVGGFRQVEGRHLAAGQVLAGCAAGDMAVLAACGRVVARIGESARIASTHFVATDSIVVSVSCAVIGCCRSAQAAGTATKACREPLLKGSGRAEAAFSF